MIPIMKVQVHSMHSRQRNTHVSTGFTQKTSENYNPRQLNLNIQVWN